MRVIVDSKQVKPGQPCSISVYFERVEEDDEGNYVDARADRHGLPPEHPLHGLMGGCRESADQAMLWAIDMLTQSLRASAAYGTTGDTKYSDADCCGIGD